MLFGFNISLHDVATIRFCNIVKHRYLLNKAVVVAIENNGNKKKFANVRGDISLKTKGSLTLSWILFRQGSRSLT